MFIAFLTMFPTNNDAWMSVFQNFGTVAFVIMGFAFTARSFSEMGTYSKSLQYISLPASRCEKFTSAWVITSVVYITIATIMLVITSALMSLVAMSIYGGGFQIFNPFTIEYGNVILTYFVAHSAFFLGAVWFNKATFFKTILAMFIINIIVNVWMFVLGMLIINPFKFLKNSMNMYFNIEEIIVAGPILKHFIIGFVILMAVYLLLTAWVRFKEREV